MSSKQEMAFKRIFEIRENFHNKFEGKSFPEMTWTDLHECRKEHKRAAKALLDRVEKEKRDLTEEENLAWEDMQTRLGQIQQEFDRREDKKIAMRALEEQYGQSFNTGTGSGPVFSGPNGKIRALKVNENLADSQRFNMPADVRAEDLSLGRWFRAIVTGDWRGAEAEHRAMSTSNDTLGGYLVPTPLAARVIDLARKQARVMQAGALTVPMESSTLKIGKVTGDPSAHWKAENAPAVVSDMSFGLITLNARTLVGLAKLSVELVEDAANIDSLVENTLATILALELDRSALWGSGAGEPLGIRNWEGVQKIDMGVNGGALAGYDNFSRAWEMIQNVNGPSEGLSAIYAPRTAGFLDRMKDGQGLPLTPPPSWKDVKKFTTNQVPVNLTKGNANNASEAYFGHFENLLMGLRTDLRIEISREAADSDGSAFRNLQVWIRAYLRADVALARPDHFVLIDGILP